MTNINRRAFLKALGLTGAAAAAAPLAINAQDGQQSAGGQMEMRTSSTGDKVSLLGYGCMRMPTVGNVRGAEVDMEAQMRLIDYAIEHGVNYFDLSLIHI